MAALSKVAEAKDYLDGGAALFRRRDAIKINMRNAVSLKAKAAGSGAANMPALRIASSSLG